MSNDRLNYDTTNAFRKPDPRPSPGEFYCEGGHRASLLHRDTANPGMVCRLCSYDDKSLAQFVNHSADMADRLRRAQRAPRFTLGGIHD